MPPDQFRALPPDHFSKNYFNSYDDIVKFWVKTISAATDFNILIHLHPRTEFEDVKYIEQSGVKIVRKPIEELISTTFL